MNIDRKGVPLPELPDALLQDDVHTTSRSKYHDQGSERFSQNWIICLDKKIAISILRHKSPQ